MDWFKNYRKAVVDNYAEKSETEKENENEIKNNTADKPTEEWIWINGYKATDKDMKCRGYQFELNKCFDISDDKPVELCEHGFHLCAKFNKVLNYYRIGDGNRFFEVKALVRKRDFDNLGPRYCVKDCGFKHYLGENDKLAAKSIIFTRELTIDEILGSRVPADWTDEQKKLALEIGIPETREKIIFEKLVALGYSETFARLCMDEKRANVALSVGTQEGLSMDMKAWLIFKVNK